VTWIRIMGEAFALENVQRLENDLLKITSLVEKGGWKRRLRS